ncbi:alpha/beta hydrolase [Terriglobus saanensis]|uniref:Alpha/beta hydrolase n=1 Tax=Terriglobus saanensis (strain ATCC BAA-1853 / DSM 23119 / SP1PR4) TaxID=401053 RepID=E8V1M4_TERSS|nr:alpha/beta hydrolase [Terriglobus saanensis]ADV82305.1 alpha/beta hydrolase [Terriglobus saanensis SP1PR4]
MRNGLRFGLAAILGIALSAGGQAVVMDKAVADGHVAVPLWSGAAPGAQGTASADIPTLTTYLPTSNPTKTAVIVAPGGGYAHLALDHEGAQVAQWLNAHGVAAFVLTYRLGPKYHHPVELGDAQRAIRTVRASAEKNGIATDHIGMLGFSAGGHLASTAGTHFDAGNVTATDPIEQVSSRPDFLVLAYPVISLRPAVGHVGSAKNLLGDNPDPALVTLLSNDEQVTPQTPPSFIWSTTDDATVPVMNSVLFYSALVKNKVQAELHIFRHGKHGLGLAQGDVDIKVWPDLLLHWMAANGWAQLPAAQ